jgi:hypothetical protein
VTQDGPVFNEPWKAQAFALAVRLSDAGYFTWSEWATIMCPYVQAILTSSGMCGLPVPCRYPFTPWRR